MIQSPQAPSAETLTEAMMCHGMYRPITDSNFYQALPAHRMCRCDCVVEPPQAPSVEELAETITSRAQATGTSGLNGMHRSIANIHCFTPCLCIECAGVAVWWNLRKLPQLTS